MSKGGIALIAGLVAIVLIAVYIIYRIYASRVEIKPSGLKCYAAKDGTVIDYKFNPKRIFGFGLTYRSHVKETSSHSSLSFIPPIFKKDTRSLAVKPSSVQIPDKDQLLKAAEKIEPGLKQKIHEQCNEIDPLLDYEVELAFVLLENVDWEQLVSGSYFPKIGYFISNDVSCRFIQILGEGQRDRFDYWGASKSFTGFLPVNNEVWIPLEQAGDTILCIELECMINGKVRQQERTTHLAFTPEQMMKFIFRTYPDDLPEKGDIILTGTPAGVALQVPAWKARLAQLVNLDRFTKVNSVIQSARKEKRFLKPGDVITFSGGILGSHSITVAE